MVLCPEVLALIVANALLSKHHGTQREREIRTAGVGQGSPQQYSEEQGHPLPPLLASDNWAWISTFSSAWIWRKELCVANRKLPTSFLQIQTNYYFFLKVLWLRRESCHAMQTSWLLFVSAQRTWAWFSATGTCLTWKIIPKFVLWKLPHWADCSEQYCIHIMNS